MNYLLAVRDKLRPSSGAAQVAAWLLSQIEDLEGTCSYSREALLPIAASDRNIDVFVITRPQSFEPRRVLWLAGQLVENVPSFDEYFLSMVDYNRLMHQRLTEG